MQYIQASWHPWLSDTQGAGRSEQALEKRVEGSAVSASCSSVWRAKTAWQVAKQAAKQAAKQSAKLKEKGTCAVMYVPMWMPVSECVGSECVWKRLCVEAIVWERVCSVPMRVAALGASLALLALR